MGMTDRELVEGIVSGNDGAIRFLVGTYQKQVIKTAYYFLQNMEDAEDLSQEVFLDVIRDMKHFRGNSSLATWIYRITVNKSLNCVRKKKRRGFFHQVESLFNLKNSDEPEQVVVSSSAANDLEAKENRKILYDAVNILPENQRVAFVLSKFDGLPYKEISGIMNVSVSSVESLIHRAKMNLQKNLSGEFPEYSKNHSL